MITRKTFFLGWLALALFSVLGMARADDLGPFLAHADAVNNFVYKTYNISPGKGYSLKVDLQTEIRTYKGKKDRSDFKIPYNSAFQKVHVRYARTVLPSGKVLSVRQNEIQDILDPATADSSIYSKARLRIINFPGVVVGSRIEVSFTIISDLPFWADESFRLSDPTLEKRVIVDIPVRSKSRLPLLCSKLDDPLVHFSKLEKAGSVIYEWTGKDLPKQVSEPQAPELQNEPFCLLLSRFASWQEVSEFFMDRLRVNKIKESFSLPNWAAKAEPDKIYEGLLDHLSVYPIDLFDTNIIPQTPAETLEKGYGSPLDLAILFYSILKRQGISSSLVLVNTQGVFVEQLASCFHPGLFNQVLVRCGDKFYAFVDKDLPPGVNEAGGNLGLDIGEGRLVKISSSTHNQNAMDLALTLTPQHQAFGQCSFAFYGLSTKDIRKQMRYVSGKELDIKICEILHHIDPTADLRGRLESKGLYELSQVVKLSLGFSLDTPLAYTAGRYFFPLPDCELLSRLGTYLPERHYGISFSQAQVEVLSVTLDLPTNLGPVRTPKASKGRIGPLSWEISSRLHNGKLSFYRRISVGRGVIPAGEVTVFLKKVAELISVQNRVLVFEKRPSSNGATTVF